MALYLPLMLRLILTANDQRVLAICLILYAAIFSVMASTINTFAIESIPAKYRMSCSSFCYSLGMGFLGGTVPAVSTVIVRWFGEDPIFISGYISLVCLLAASSSLIVLVGKALTENIAKLPMNSN
jgi:hypothetical protein